MLQKMKKLFVCQLLFSKPGVCFKKTEAGFKITTWLPVHPFLLPLFTYKGLIYPVWHNVHAFQ
jgi:hypothetical protein